MDGILNCLKQAMYTYSPSVMAAGGRYKKGSNALRGDTTLSKTAGELCNPKCTCKFKYDIPGGGAAAVSHNIASKLGTRV